MKISTLIGAIAIQIEVYSFSGGKLAPWFTHGVHAITTAFGHPV